MISLLFFCIRTAQAEDAARERRHFLWQLHARAPRDDGRSAAKRLLRANGRAAAACAACVRVGDVHLHGEGAQGLLCSPRQWPIRCTEPSNIVLLHQWLVIKLMFLPPSSCSPLPSLPLSNLQPTFFPGALQFFED